MENIFVEFLPPWIETGRQPAFYDKESGSVLQQTARMYARVNMLIRMFNKLSRQTKETVEEYINKFNELHDYVMDYFANLDVQEEINNKLDAMVEAGTLQEIVADYLNSKAVFGYDSVADMQSATNLIDGSYAETLGFYAKNDGGSAKYKIRNITNDDVVDGITIIEISSDPSNNLIAELVITKNMSVKQFGAKGDGTTNDRPSFVKMLEKCETIYAPKGRYHIDSPISFEQIAKIRVEGSILYDGSDYALEFTNTNYLDMYIRTIGCPNGGGVKLVPSSGHTISFNKIRIDYGETKYSVVEMNGDNGSISNMFFDGMRWYSTNSSACNMVMTSSAVSSFITEIVFENINFWTSNSRAGVTTNNDSNNGIQLKFHKVSFEDSWGIHCTGKILNISLYDCRIEEIKDTQGWLTFDGYLPYVLINGCGDSFLDLEYITLNNITSTKEFLTTNMEMKDHVTTYKFPGGGVANKDRILPFNLPFVTKVYNTGGNVTFSDLTRSGGIYNCFNFTANQWLAFTIPANLWQCVGYQIYVKPNYGINMTLSDGNITTPTITTTAGKTYRFSRIMGNIICEEVG